QRCQTSGEDRTGAAFVPHPLAGADRRCSAVASAGGPTTMNCDHAFDLMTDPALDDCAQLHAHLDECPRCRQMYETLSPALGLFVSSGTASEDAPADAAMCAGGVEIAERVAVHLAQEPPMRVPSA